MLNSKGIDLLLENNFLAKARFLPDLCPSMEVISLANGITYINSTLASDTFNIIAAKSLTEDLKKAQAEQIVAFYTAKTMPLAWWVGPNSARYGVDRILSSVGLEQVETEIGMANYIDNIKVNFNGCEVENFKVKEVRSDKDFESYGYVMASVFEPFDVEAVKFYKKISQHYKKSQNVRMFVGHVNDDPAGICFTINAEGIGGIYDIVTNPTYQKRGIGTFMTKLAIEKLKQDKCQIVGMQASVDGMGIYKKLGFESFGEFKVYSNTKMLG